MTSRRNLLLLSVLLLLGGCSSGQTAASFAAASEPVSAELAAIPVRRIMTTQIAGSAVHVGKDLLLTCQHLLTAPVIEIDRSLTRYEVVASGGSKNSFVGDWALIRLLDVSIGLPAVPVRLDDGPKPPLHEEILLVGYWARDFRTRQQLSQAESVMIRGRVRSRPLFHPGELIYFDAPLRGTYEGLSGGPAVRVDPADGSVRLLGIYTGTYANILFGHGFWMTHVIRPVPEEVRAYVK